MNWRDLHGGGQTFIASQGRVNVGLVFAPCPARPFFAWSYYLDALAGQRLAHGNAETLAAAQREIELHFDQFIEAAQLMAHAGQARASDFCGTHEV